MYPEKIITEEDTCTPMFIAALFTIVRIWKQPRCPLTDEWIKKLWYIHDGILLSHKRRARWSNQSILKEINPQYSLEGLMLKWNLQYFGHLMWRVNSLEKALMLGKAEGRRTRRWQKMRWLDCIIDSMDISLSKLQEIGKDRGACHVVVHGVTNSRIQTNNNKKEMHLSQF